jgi:hypothetical protein
MELMASDNAQPADGGVSKASLSLGPWSEERRRSFALWRNHYPSLAYARGDPHTFYVPIDHAAQMAGLNQFNFYKRYLLSNRLPYVVKHWWHGRRHRRKSFIPRNALLELLARELCESAKLHMKRRGHPAIPRKARLADLDRMFEERDATRLRGNQR